MKNKKQKINLFKYRCSKCGSHKITEVITDIISRCQLSGISRKGKIRYSRLDWSDGKTSHFECSECGRLILDDTGRKITSKAQFIKCFKWLKSKGTK